ncbi:hypothetical protein DP42_3886 [Burkholderia pseudomallei]|nr:hypothetical protein DP42_3886 [Burkholderia pseudomallei]
MRSGFGRILPNSAQHRPRHSCWEVAVFISKVIKIKIDPVIEARADFNRGQRRLNVFN